MFAACYGWFCALTSDHEACETLLTADAATVGALRRHRRFLRLALQVTSSDKQWFERYPMRLVRFRPERRADFELFTLQGQEPPAFIPDGLDPTAPLSWVAVVDVLRATGLPAAPHHGAIRTRIRTVPIRSRALQASMAEVFAIAVCRDLLHQIQREQGTQDLVA